MFPNKLDFDLEEISHCIVCDEVTTHPEELCSEDCYRLYVAIEAQLQEEE